MAAADFWDNQEKAREVVAELKGLKAVLKPWRRPITAADDLATLVEMAARGRRTGGRSARRVGRVWSSASKMLETKALLSGPLDANSALLTINARDGGTDANDWAEMLLRMYLNWAKDHDYDTELLDRQDNEEAGINSATIAVRGPMAYGLPQRRERHPSAGPHQPLQRRGQAADQLRRRRRLARSLRRRPTSKSARTTSRSRCFAPAAPAGSTSTRPPARCG